MPLLYHWVGKNYRRDLDWGAGYHLNQSNPLLHVIEPGDSLWAFTRTPSRKYVLAMELVVCAKSRNPPGYRYGEYRLWLIFNSLESSLVDYQCGTGGLRARGTTFRGMRGARPDVAGHATAGFPFSPAGSSSSRRMVIGS
ncbi:MAG: hypothetical protein OXE86_03255, partial [Alphaproteobacteria bacterium]|nr:hypothetical protein [Alphaproteobacteria bacterium]